MKHLLLCASLSMLLVSCGATYDITRQDGGKIYSEQFTKDKYSCELQSTAMSSHLDNGSALGGVSRDLKHNELLVMCMESKGWKYTKTSTNLF
jgi:hypothetical protein